MIFDEPLPFEEALQDRRLRAVLPTTLSSRELQTIDASILRRATFSARVDRVEVLQSIDTLVAELLSPAQGSANLATAKLRLKEAVQATGYQAQPGEAGTIKDLTSNARRKLILRTNVQTAQGRGQYEQGMQDGARDAMPAWELVRFEGRKVPREWKNRWQRAAQAAGDNDALRVFGETGRLIARKDSPVWEQLGSKELFEDALGNPYEPFAFNSGMGRLARSRSEALKLGLITAETRITTEGRLTEAPIEDRSVGKGLIDALRVALEDEGYLFDEEGVLIATN